MDSMDMNSRCSRPGECGAEAAGLTDELTGALIGLVRTADSSPNVNGDTWRLLLEGLAVSAGGAGVGEEDVRDMIERVRREKHRLSPNCAFCASPCGRTADYDIASLEKAPEDVRALKSRILGKVRETAVRARQAETSGHPDEAASLLIARALFAVGEDLNADELQPILDEIWGTGEQSPV